MTIKKSPEAEIIDVDRYPAMLDGEAAEAFLTELSLRDTSKRANNAQKVACTTSCARSAGTAYAASSPSAPRVVIPS